MVTEPSPERGRTAVVVAVVVSLVVPVTIALGGAVALWWFDRVDTVGTVEFERELRVPELAGSTVDDDGTRVFDLTMQTGRTDLTGRGEAETWGIDGTHLAPTLRAARGEQVRVQVRNDLPEVSTLHWHGLHVPATEDGGPHQRIEPGTSWSPSWTLDQPAATAWFHPHAHGTTAEHVRRGVYGMFIVDDDSAAAASLPQEYGVDDVPVMVQDASFDVDGQLRAGRSGPSPAGPLGDVLMVNGTIGAYLDVTTETVRLRLLNASAARVYDFVLDDGRSFELVGTDGGLLPAPVETTSLPLSPGERAEVLVRLEPGERVVLRSRGPDLGASAVTSRMTGGNDTFDVLELRAADRLRASTGTVAAGARAPDLHASGVTATRTFDLAGDTINDRRMDPSRVDEVVPARTTERWVVRNVDGLPHNFHVHGTAFVVAEVDGSAPPAHLGGWKDTVYVAPGSTVQLLVRFDGPADASVPFMYHCHLLAHHDEGMMGQLVVVEPGADVDQDVGEDVGEDVGAAPGPRGAGPAAAEPDVASALFPGAVGHDH